MLITSKLVKVDEGVHIKEGGDDNLSLDDRDDAIVIVEHAVLGDNYGVVIHGVAVPNFHCKHRVFMS